MAEPCEPVGIPEIAEALGRSRQTVDNWLNATRRGVMPHPFPEPRWTVGGRSAWNLPDVQAWARATGRHEEKDWPYRSDVCPHGVPYEGVGGKRNADASGCPQCAHDAERAEYGDNLPHVTLTITEKRPRHVVWEAVQDGRTVAGGGPVLTVNAAERLAREVIDDKLGKDAYRLEVVHQ